MASKEKARNGVKGDAKVLDVLNKALRHEMTAVNQYWLHYRLLETGDLRGWQQRSGKN